MSLKGTEEETGGGDGHAELEAEAGVTPPQAKERLGQQSWKGLGKPPLAPPGGAALPARGCGTWLRDVAAGRLPPEPEETGFPSF